MVPNSCSSMSKSPRISPVSQPVVSSSTVLPRERDGTAPSGGNGNGQIQESEPAWLLCLRSGTVSVSSGGRAGHFPDLRTLQKLAFLKVPVFLKIDETQPTHSTSVHSACKRILVFFLLYNFSLGQKVWSACPMSISVCKNCASVRGKCCTP